MKVLLISDYDGTIGDLRIRANLGAIREFVQKGHVLNISTARTYRDIKTVTNCLKIDYQYLTCDNGAVSFDANNRVIKLNAFNKRELEFFNDCLKNNKNCLNITFIDYHGNRYSNNIPNYHLDSITSIQVICNPFYDLSKEFRNIPGYKCDHYCGNIYNIKRAYVNKAYGASNVIDHLVKQDEEEYMVYSVGNSYNDLCLLKKYNGYRTPLSSKVLKNNQIKKTKSVHSLINKII